jgi:dCTP deaminase
VILSDLEIRARCQAGMVTPFDPALVNPASLDVRLGPRIRIESATSTELILLDLEREGWDDQTPYMLRPGQFILAETIETFHLPDDVAAQFMLKSSRAREGIEHLMAGYCDPGWHGSKLTMELHNSRQLHPVAIWPGMKIGQLVFHQMSQAPERSYAVTGRYNRHDVVMGSLG